MQKELGRITIVVSCNVIQYEDDDDTTIADGPPTLAVEIDLPVSDSQQVPITIGYLRKIADQLEADLGDEG